MKKYARLFVCAALLMLLLPASCFATLSFFNGGYIASPSPAKAGDNVSIMFVEYDSYYIAPSVTVTVNGHSTANLQHTGPYGPCTYFTCSYTVLGSGQDPDGAASIEIYATDSMNQSNDYIATSWLLLDSTNPTTPAVTDDGAYTGSTSLHASWTASSATSGIAQYQYAVGTTSGGTNVVGWTSAGTSTSVTTGSLSLTSGQTYYISVKAQSNVGLWSSVESSDGIAFNTSPPTTPIVTDDGIATSSTSQLHATWASSDAMSGIAEYRYAIGTSPTDPGTGYTSGWVSTGTNAYATATGLSLQSGSTYYFYVKAENAAGVWSSVGCSDGIAAVAQAIPADASDYLGESGSFDQCTYVRWYANYTGGPCYDSSTVWLDSNSLNGYNLPETNDRVSDGWIRSTNADIIPGFNTGSNATYDLLSDGGYDWQLISVNGLTDGGLASIDQHVSVDNTKSWRIHTGDTITLQVDRVKMANYTNLPSGSSVDFRMRLSCNSGYYPYQELPASTSSFADQLTYTVPTGTTDINVQFYIVASRNLGTVSPQLYVSGAHLFVERSGASAYETRPVPVQQIRTIKTENVQYHAVWSDGYATARDYDEISTAMDEYATVETMRHYNPSLKVNLYQSATTCIAEAPIGALLPASPYTFWEISYVPTQGQNPMNAWLYGDGNGGYINTGSYADRYPLKITYNQGYDDESDYQYQWAQNAIAHAQVIGADGLWLDDLQTNANTYITPPLYRTNQEVQQFEHRVYPMLRTAGLKIVQNACAIHIYDGAPVDWAGDNGHIFLDPFWVPDATYTTALGYVANTPETTPDVFFQEWAFVLPEHTTYGNAERDYWIGCLKDMDTISGWNANLNANEQKTIHMDIDAPTSAADSWLHFGLCSYLLAQHDWSSVGFGVYGQHEYPAVDTSITKTLGLANGDRVQPDTNNDYLLYRNYVSDGSANSYGGIVVVNGGESSATFTPTSTVYLEGTGHPYGPNETDTYINIAAHTGVIFLNTNPY